MRIVLLRHGRTEANDRRLYCGSTDLPLSPSGRAALEAFRDGGGYPDIAGYRVYTSGLLRAEETLSILYGETVHAAAPGLREADFGAFEMRGYEELKDDPAFQLWCTGDNEANVPPDGESGKAMTARVLACFHALASAGEDLFLVSHGGPIAAIMAELFPDENKNRWEWQPKNGEGYLLTLGETSAWERIPAKEEPMADDKPSWEGKAYSFFQNTACEYFPCHKTKKPEDFNCLFCYCPLFALGDQCGGNFRYNEKGNKDCTGCLFPHVRANYGKVLEKYPRIRELAAKNRKTNEEK